MKDKKIEFANIFIDCLSKNVYSKISVNDLCDVLKCSRQSFYYYYPTTDDCFRFAVLSSLESSIQNEFLITDLFDYVDNNRPIIDNCLLERNSMILLKEILVNFCEDNLEFIISRNVPDFVHLKEETKKDFISFTVAGILRLLELYYCTNDKSTKDRYLELSHTMLGTSNDISATVNRLLNESL